MQVDLLTLFEQGAAGLCSDDMPISGVFGFRGVSTATNSTAQPLSPYQCRPLEPRVKEMKGTRLPPLFRRTSSMETSIRQQRQASYAMSRLCGVVAGWVDQRN